LNACWGQRNYLGKLWLDSKPVPQRLTTAERIRMGMSLVPEDRKRTGIFPARRSPAT
jgi:erythritol transport system ATP-binding protein